MQSIDKQHIIDLFNNNVKGKPICIDGISKNHCGAEGNWLERQMNIKPNSKNMPDIDGYEMKKMSGKITLGDYSACEYAFSGKDKRNYINDINEWTNDIRMSRSEFIKIFGNPNPDKNNRYSWSGKCVPKYNEWNLNGQKLSISENNDIIIYYSYSKDTRDKKNFFPEFLKNENILIAIWKKEKMKQYINNKFNKNGFFICVKKENKYEEIHFGKPFDFEYFIESIKNRKIKFDSGMYDGNNRNYSHFRGTNFWNDLIIEKY